jgi:hypothetical protein
MKDIFKRETDFGSTRSRENFFSFTLKFIFYIIPAVLLGNYTDRIVQTIKENNIFRILFYRHLLL